MKITRQSSDDLRAQTQALVTALRRPEARGRWGEMQLRRVVELAGMAPRCDFDEQVTVQSAEGTFRPDMVVRLAGGKNIVVDSKVSLAAYLEAAEASDDVVRAARLDAHARHLRAHVDQLAAKSYWATLSPAPEFVVLFIPGEAFLAPALEHDPALLEHAMARKVHIATPTTLVTMLRTAQYAWQQDALAENARAAFDLGRELYERISSLGRNVDRLGRALTSAVTTYNQTVGSLETRVLVSARKLNQLGVVDGDLETPMLIEEATRTLSAPELVVPELAAPELATPRASARELAAAELAPPESSDPESPPPESSDPESPAPESSAREPSAPESCAPQFTVPAQPDPPEPRRPSPEPPELPRADETPGTLMAMPGRNGAAS
jgi:DNA recombination protein RmuC